MKIIISGKQLKVTDAIKTYTEEKISRISKYSDAITEVDVVLTVEDTKSEGPVHKADGLVFASGTKIKIEALKTSLDNILKTYRELMPVTETGYSLIFGIPSGNPVIDFMDVDGIIKASKRKYAKTDFKKLQKLSQFVEDAISKLEINPIVARSGYESSYVSMWRM